MITNNPSDIEARLRMMREIESDPDLAPDYAQDKKNDIDIALRVVAADDNTSFVTRHKAISALVLRAFEKGLKAGLDIGQGPK